VDLDGAGIGEFQARQVEGKDTHELTHELREHGIRVQGSTIIGLEHHTPANIAAEIEHAISHETDFYQFMLYTPVPGTPLYREMKEQGRMLDSVDLADIHGQFKFNFKHAAISRDDPQRYLDFAFWYDFERNGPSLYRMCGTMLKGWKRYRDYPDPRVRERFEREVAELRSGYIAALWAMEHQFRSTTRRWASRFDLFAKSGKGIRRAHAVQFTYPGPVHAVDGAPRRTPPGRGQNLRTTDVRRTHTLVVHLRSSTSRCSTSPR
jgi:hypothetical protein